MLVACRLAGLSALEAYYAGVNWRAQCGAFTAYRADHAVKAKIVPGCHSAGACAARINRSARRATSQSRVSTTFYSCQSLAIDAL